VSGAQVQERGPEPLPECPDHASALAVGTCSRCGRFACAQCLNPGGRCRGCVALTVGNLPSSAGQAQACTYVLWVCLVLQICCAICWGMISFGNQRVIPLLEGVIEFEALARFVGCATFLHWEYRFLRRARALDIEFGGKPGWVLVWWLVPLANLVKPFHVVRAALTGVGTAPGRAPMRASTLELWWAAWLGYTLLSRVEVGGRWKLDLEIVAVAQTLSLVSGVAGALLLMQILSSAEAAMAARTTLGASDPVEGTEQVGAAAG